MAAYHFVKTWRLRAPVADVWAAIAQIERYPQWWTGVKKVEPLRPGDEAGIGKTVRMTWRSKLPYDLVFDSEVIRVEPPSYVEGRATGELEGRGAWSLEHSGDVTTCVYTWEVRTTAAWMNFLAPIARPLFSWNHDYVMKRGAEGLARMLNAELLLA